MHIVRLRMPSPSRPQTSEETSSSNYCSACAGMARSAGPYGASTNSPHAVLGFADHGDGRLAVYGDSNCLDSSHQRSSCHALLLNAIQYVAEVNDPAARCPPSMCHIYTSTNHNESHAELLETLAFLGIT